MTDSSAVTIVRLVHAPREAVWDAWTDPDQLARWWWPERYQTTYQIDLRVGGGYRFESAELPDLGTLAISGKYLEIARPEHLVYTWEWDGEAQPPSRVTVDFVDRGAGTELRITHEGLANAEERGNHLRGWAGCLERLSGLFDTTPETLDRAASE